jgi:hypothetical protein
MTNKDDLKVGDKLLIHGYRYAEVTYVSPHGGVDIEVFGVGHCDPLSYYGKYWGKIKAIITEK